jgi:hypothetical protein
MGKTSESIIKAEKYSGVSPRIPSLESVSERCQDIFLSSTDHWREERSFLR